MRVTMRRKGYRPKTIDLEYVRHVSTRTVGSGCTGGDNTDTEVWRDVVSGTEFTLDSNSNDAGSYPASIVLGRREEPLAVRLGMQKR